MTHEELYQSLVAQNAPKNRICYELRMAKATNSAISKLTGVAMSSVPTLAAAYRDKNHLPDWNHGTNHSNTSGNAGVEYKPVVAEVSVASEAVSSIDAEIAKLTARKQVLKDLSTAHALLNKYEDCKEMADFVLKHIETLKS